MAVLQTAVGRTALAQARPQPAGVLGRNGYARLADLEDPSLLQTLREMEMFQAEFMASTRELWTPDFAFTGDCLYNWSRRWEYPYCRLNLPDERPCRVLDAGSGITFFPFLLARQGFQVACADIDRGLVPVFERAGHLTRVPIEFRACGIESLDWPDRSFDAVACVSVLEHVPGRTRAMDELARVLEPGGRLVITWDVSLSRDCDVRMEDVAVLLAGLRRHFDPLHPLDLLRPSDLLTTDRMRGEEAWRLPWHLHRRWLRRMLGRMLHGDPYRSIAVMGTTWVKRG